MSFYQRYVIPRLTHIAMRQKQLLPFRQRVIGAAEGRVLEIGIGSGLNLPLYGDAVTSVIGLEPSPALLHMARARAEAAPAPITLLDASAETIPAGQRQHRYGRDDLDTLHDSQCSVRAGRDAPRVETERRTTIRRARARAGANRCALARPARSAVVASRRRLPSQPQDR